MGLGRLGISSCYLRRVLERVMTAQYTACSLRTKVTEPDPVNSGPWALARALKLGKAPRSYNVSSVSLGKAKERAGLVAAGSQKPP